jgi:hypothetical protein
MEGIWNVLGTTHRLIRFICALLLIFLTTLPRNTAAADIIANSSAAEWAFAHNAASLVPSMWPSSMLSKVFELPGPHLPHAEVARQFLNRYLRKLPQARRRRPRSGPDMVPVGAASVDDIAGPRAETPDAIGRLRTDLAGGSVGVIYVG